MEPLYYYSGTLIILAILLGYLTFRIFTHKHQLGVGATRALNATYVGLIFMVIIFSLLIMVEHYQGSNYELTNKDGYSVIIREKVKEIHPEDAIDQVKEIYSMLRKGGKYICITPNGINGPHDISRFYGNDLVGFHLKEYLPSELKKLFIGTGFKRVRAYMIVKKRPIYISIRIIRLIEIMLHLFSNKTRKKLCNFSILKRINNAIIIAIK